jgi:hypothetical protein
MKKALLLGSLFLLVLSVRAQSFMFYRDSQPLEDNAEFTVSDYQVYLQDDDYTLLSQESGLRLENTTNQNIQTTVTQTILEGPLDRNNGYLSFCFLDCSMENANKVKTGTIPANSFSAGYHDNFYVFQGVYNRVKVRYEVYATTNSADKKTVTVTYVYNENSVNQLNVPALQPAITVFQEGNQVKIDYALDLNFCQLEVYNLSGQKIAQHLLTSDTGTFTLSKELTKGVYLCVVKNGKQLMAVQKFIVK